jgi:hypothetical protein
MASRPVLLLFSLCAVLFLGACVGNQEPEPEACDDDGSLLFDSFDGQRNCGWALYRQGGTTVEIAESSLRLSTSQPGQLWWTNPGRNFDDVIMTGIARQMSGPDDNAYGLICRYQSPENFYVFLVSGDGYYAIGKYQSGSPQIQYLTGDGQYAFSDVINQGIAINEIRATCIGSELTLSVNGLFLATATDPTFVTGDVGLAASTFDPGTAVISFDSMRVIRP